MVDLDGNGTTDGIFVGEPGSYGANWWLASSTDPAIQAGAPHDERPAGYMYGTLVEWSDAFANAVVRGFGFSLGSGVFGDGVINSITFDDVTYTFRKHTVLASKDECKDGGWRPAPSRCSTTRVTA